MSDHAPPTGPGPDPTESPESSSNRMARLPARASKLIVRRTPGLGDILQRLAIIAPEDVHGLTLIARDTLRRAEARHALHRRRGRRY